jgi:hypothetical protein
MKKIDFSTLSDERKEFIREVFLYADMDFFMQFCRDMTSLEKSYSMAMVTNRL